MLVLGSVGFDECLGLRVSCGLGFRVGGLGLVPHTTIGQFLGTLKGDLLSRSAQGSGWLDLGFRERRDITTLGTKHIFLAI